MSDSNDSDYPVETRPLLARIRAAGLDKKPCSPSDMLKLKDRMDEDDELKRLIRKMFRSADSLRRASEAGMEFIMANIAYRILDISSIYVLIYGTRSMGKSEVGQVLQIEIDQLFRELRQMKMTVAFSRDHASSNTQLAEAVKNNKHLILLFDEPEKQSGTGTNAERDGFYNNVITMRVLNQNVLRASVLFDWQFGAYCDFALEVIFKDKLTRTNYCIVWVIGSERRRKRAKYIVGIPLHTNDKLRAAYETIKNREQLRLTSARGRRNRMLEVCAPKVDALVQLAIDQGMRVIEQRRWKELKPLLEFHVQDGGTLVGEEKESVCREATMRLKDWFEGPPTDPDKDLLAEYVWESDFTWRDEIAALMERDSRFKDYYLFFLAREVELLNPNKNAKKFSEITGRSKSQNYTVLKKMDGDQEFQGWLKHQRSRLHERYLAQKFAADGWQVEEKPRFVHEGLEYEEDLLIARDGREVWLNAKCGSGFRTYVTEEFKTTHILANVLKRETYILYLDLETGVHEIREPKERVSVGSKEASLKALRTLAKGANPSTPSLLLRALAGTAGKESAEHV